MEDVYSGRQLVCVAGWLTVVAVVVVVSSALQDMFRCRNSCGCSVTRQKTSDQAPIRYYYYYYYSYYYCTDIAVVPRTKEKTSGSGIRLRDGAAVSSASSTYSYSSITYQVALLPAECLGRSCRDV